MTTFEAILLAGGKASRMGGADKLSFEYDGRSLLQGVVDAALEVGCSRITIVGPSRPIDTRGMPLSFVTEDPPFGGPVAGIAAGIGNLRADWILLLATDLVAPLVGLQALAREVSADPNASALVVTDETHKEQWLFSAARRLELNAALQSGAIEGSSMRELFRRFPTVRTVRLPNVPLDIDTWEDWRAHNPQGRTANSIGNSEHD